MNSVLFPVCSPAPSHMTLSDILNSEMNSFNPCWAMDLDSMGYTAVKKPSVANTCAYLFPSRDLCQASKASVKVMPHSHGCLYILSALYHHASGIITDKSNHWFIAFIVFAACETLMRHLVLMSLGDTERWLSLLWNVCTIGTSCLVATTMQLASMSWL